ncbi:MAG: C4-dicarboxylate ABC transporter [Actinobacteria bacterium]|jgi:tellurite resistance protein|nr:C4-dicarboxylate ABC transporter [Actinomycetota bacterium]
MTQEAKAPASRLGNFPVSFFSIVMGLNGLAIATQKIEGLLGTTNVSSTVLLALTLAVFLIITLVYALKLVRHRQACIQEFNDPVGLSFFPAFSINFLLVAVAFLPVSKTASLVFWVIGAVLHLMLTLIILSIWVQQQKFEIKHMCPVWFIPVVGNILVPVAGVEHAPDEISWLFFSIGVVFWVILQTLFFYRIFFHHPLPEKLLPTFFILLAPPVVGAIAYVKLSGGLDAFTNILYYYGLFIFLFLLVQVGMLRKARFHLSWWAYSFPVAALVIASTMMHAQTGLLFYRVLAFVVFAIVVILICLLALLTIVNIIRARICVEE